MAQNSRDQPRGDFLRVGAGELSVHMPKQQTAKTSLPEGCFFSMGEGSSDLLRAVLPS